MADMTDLQGQCGMTKAHQKTLAVRVRSQILSPYANGGTAIPLNRAPSKANSYPN
jgi:hypothetical protein